MSDLEEDEVEGKREEEDAEGNVKLSGQVPQRRKLAKTDSKGKKSVEMSEEQRSFLKEQNKWRKRLYRARDSKTLKLTEEELEEVREKYKLDVTKLLNRKPKKGAEQEEVVKPKRKKLTKEEVKERERERARFRYLEKRLNMTDEEKEEMKRKWYFKRQAYYAKHGRYPEMPREYKDKKNEREKNWRQNLTPEARKRWMDSVNRANKKQVEKVKREQPERWKMYKEKQREYFKNKYRNNEQERAKRRFNNKVSWEKRKLKKRLEEEGANKEEIEQRLKLIHEQLWKEFDPEWTWEKYGKGKGNRKRKVQDLQEQQKCLSLNDTKEISRVELPTSFKDNELNVGENSEPDWMDNNYSPDPEPVSPASPCSPVSPEVASDSLETPCSTSEDIQTFQTVFYESFNPPPVLPCAFCTLSFSQDSDLREHLQTCHSDKIWSCPKCKAVMLSPEELALHFKTLHKSATSSSSEIQQKSVNSLRNDGTTMSQIDYQFLCMRCPVEKFPVGFQTRLQLFSHVKQKHKRFYWPCKRCTILKYSRKGLKFHQTLCQQFGSVKQSNCKR